MSERSYPYIETGSLKNDNFNFWSKLIPNFPNAFIASEFLTGVWPPILQPTKLQNSFFHQ